MLRKARNRSREMRTALACLQIAVTLRAGAIRRGRQPQCALVLHVARAASGCGCLVRMVRRRIVARKTSLIAGVFEERSRFFRMAKVALLREYGMRLRQRTTGIGFLAAFNPLRRKPEQSNHRNYNGQPESPTPQCMRAREVLQVNPSGELFGGPRASQHVG